MAEKIVAPDGGAVVWALCDAIVGAKEYLSEIDGAFGDGDHGVTMAKGFALAKGRISEGDSFPCLDAMASASEKGWTSTEGMVASKGRASRMGERSKGHLDAGATSCNIVLQALAHELKARIEK